MDRRDILKSSAIFLGYAVTGGAAVAVLNGCKADTGDGWKPSTLTEKQSELLAEVVETIMPTTDTPGAKAAMVHRYIDEAITNVWEKEDRDEFLAALPQVEETAIKVTGKSFVKLDQEGRDAVMTALVRDFKASKNEDHIFKVIRELTVTGYFTSEIGATEALIFEPVPGPYKGCIPTKDVGGTYAL